MEGSGGYLLAAAGAVGCVGCALRCSGSGSGSGSDGAAASSDEWKPAWRRGHTAGGADEPASPTAAAEAPAAAEAAAAPATSAANANGDVPEWQRLKAEGTAHLKNNEPAKAIELYEAAAEALSAASGDPAQLAVLYSNCAIAREEVRASLEEEQPAAASRQLPLIVHDCSRSLAARPLEPNTSVRCKALKNRARALTAINEEASLLHAACDATTALKLAGEAAKSKAKTKAEKKQKATWKKNEGEFEKQKTAAFTKLLAKRLTAWKGRQSTAVTMFGDAVQLCGTASAAPLGAEADINRNASIRKAVYEFPPKTLVNVPEILAAFRPACSLQEVLDGKPPDWSEDQTQEKAEVPIFRLVQQASVAARQGDYAAALLSYELAARMGAETFAAPERSGVAGMTESQARVAMATADAAFGCASPPKRLLVRPA